MVWYALATKNNHGFDRAVGSIKGSTDLSVFSVKQPENLSDVIDLLFTTAHKYYGDNGSVLLKRV